MSMIGPFRSCQLHIQRAGLTVGLAIVSIVGLGAGAPTSNPSSWSETAAEAYRTGNLQEAEKTLRAALASHGTLEDGTTVVLRNQLGRVLEDRARLDEAEQEYRRAIDINQRTTAPDALETASALNNLGAIEQARGHFMSAENLLKQAYSVIERNGDVSSALSGSVLSNIGLNAQEQGRYEAAHEAYRQASVLIQQFDGEKSEEFAKLLKNEAILSLETGNAQDAIRINKEALRLENTLPFVRA